MFSMVKNGSIAPASFGVDKVAAALLEVRSLLSNYLVYTLCRVLGEKMKKTDLKSSFILYSLNVFGCETD